MNVSNLVLMSVLKFLVVAEFLIFTSDTVYKYEADKISKATPKIEENVKQLVTLDFVNFSFQQASKLPRESKNLMTELITPEDMEKASKYFQV